MQNHHAKLNIISSTQLKLVVELAHNEWAVWDRWFLICNFFFFEHSARSYSYVFSACHLSGFTSQNKSCARVAPVSVVLLQWEQNKQTDIQYCMCIHTVPRLHKQANSRQSSKQLKSCLFVENSVQCMKGLYISYLKPSISSLWRYENISQHLR